MKLILSLIVLLGCSHEPNRDLSNNEKISFNLDLIHTLSAGSDSRDQNPAKLPFLAKYKKGKKEVIYLSTMHTPDIKSKTHEAILEILRDFSPNSIVVEISGYFDGRLDGILSSCDENKKCMEGSFAYLQARKNFIDATSGEPSDKEILVNALKVGMTQDEFIFFYVFRNTTSWKSSETAYPPNDPDSEILKYIDSTKRRLGLESSPFNLEKFKEIYREKRGRKFDHRDVKYEDIAPYSNGHGIQKMSVVIGKFREHFILQTLENKLRQVSKVFIIYGSGHFLKHRPVLVEAFESEEIINL
jgi:hypothetical protein